MKIITTVIDDKGNIISQRTSVINIKKPRKPRKKKTIDEYLADTRFLSIVNIFKNHGSMKLPHLLENYKYMDRSIIKSRVIKLTELGILEKDSDNSYYLSKDYQPKHDPSKEIPAKELEFA